MLAGFKWNKGTHLPMTTFLVVGGLIGWLVWLRDTPPALLFVLLPLWGIARDRREAFSLWFGYYLFGSSVIPSASGVFFGEGFWWIVGIGMWIVSSLLLAAPWTLFTLPGKWRAMGLIPAWLMVSLPPLGIIGWLNPLASAGWLMPSMGWEGVGYWFVAGLCTIATFRWASDKAHRTSLAMLVVMVVATTQFKEPHQFEVYGWVPVSTKLGKMPKNHNEAINRHADVIALIKTELAKEETRVVILPEQIVGAWTPEVAEPIWKTMMPLQKMKERRQTVLVGAEIPHGQQRENALVAFTGDGVAFTHLAVQPVPVSMWNPLSSDGVIANWQQVNNGELRDVRYTVSLCYEDLLVWPILRAFALPENERPQVILSVANQWWVKGSGEDRLQRRSIESWAYLFGATTIRATNE